MLHVYLEYRFIVRYPLQSFFPLFPSCFITETSDSVPFHNGSLHFSLEYNSYFLEDTYPVLECPILTSFISFDPPNNIGGVLVVSHLTDMKPRHIEV